jgi:acyl-CoA synthetase (AMP-forming)/AMP-acid ligase II
MLILAASIKLKLGNYPLAMSDYVSYEYSFSPVSFQSTTYDSVQKRVETVGKIVPHCTAKLVNRHGEIVPRGTPGEVWIKGYNVQKGSTTLNRLYMPCFLLSLNRYWEDEEQTQRTTVVDETDGQIWMRTGDEGIMDEEGYLRSSSASLFANKRALLMKRC